MSESSASDASERTLLHSSSSRHARRYGATTTAGNDDEAGASDISKRERTPLPMGQIAVLALARVSEPLTFTILMPFVQQMILDTGQVEVADVGYAVGLVETSFSFTQVLFLLYWSRAADTWGRKPVLLVSLFGAFLASIAFGFSTRMWQMYAARCLAGVFGGNATVIRTLFAENCDRSNQAKAFSYFAFAANIGSLVGPMIGGFLAQPALEYPRLFGSFRLFMAYPYALPCIAAATYVFITMVLCFFFLNEVGHALGLREALAPPMPRMLTIYGVTVSMSFCLSALLPLHLFTPVRLGGQDMRPAGIARVTAGLGLAQSLWLLVAMPWLDVRLGTKRLFTYTAACYPVVMALPVCANAAARAGAMGWSYALLAVYASIGSGVNMTFTSVQLLLNSTTPPAALSLINGLAQMIAASVKSIFPALVNAIYAFGVSRHVMGGYLAWLVMALFGAAVLVGSLCAPDDAEDLSEPDAAKVARVMEAEAEAPQAP